MSEYIFFTVYHMKSTGWVHISDEDSKDLHYAYQNEKDSQSHTS